MGLWVSDSYIQISIDPVIIQMMELRENARIKIGRKPREWRETCVFGDLGGSWRGIFLDYLLHPLPDLGSGRILSLMSSVSISMGRRMVDGKFLTFPSRSSIDPIISHRVYRCGMLPMTDLCVSRPSSLHLSYWLFRNIISIWNISNDFGKILGDIFVKGLYSSVFFLF